MVEVWRHVQFYLRPDDIGVNRAEATKERLQQLNSYVHVNTYTQRLTEEYLKNFYVFLTSYFDN